MRPVAVPGREGTTGVACVRACESFGGLCGQARRGLACSDERMLSRNFLVTAKNGALK